jgi:hypothetical protein
MNLRQRGGFPPEEMRAIEEAFRFTIAERKAYDALVKLCFWDPESIGLTTDEIPSINPMTFARIERSFGPRIIIVNTGKRILAHAEHADLERALRQYGFTPAATR